VEGLVKHDLENKNDKIGRTLKTILHTLENDLGYKTSWKVFDSLEFGLPQSRKRIFIVGTKDEKIDLEKIKYEGVNITDADREIIFTNLVDTDILFRCITAHKATTENMILK
jgi:site-specific DNA-cytosine methylase